MVQSEPDANRHRRIASRPKLVSAPDSARGTGPTIHSRRLPLWEEIALALLKKYTERYYTYRKREWNCPHLEYRDLSPNDRTCSASAKDPNDNYYRILIDRSQEEIVAKLKNSKVSSNAGS